MYFITPKHAIEYWVVDVIYYTQFVNGKDLKFQTTFCRIYIELSFRLTEPNIGFEKFSFNLLSEIINFDPNFGENL